MYASLRLLPVLTVAFVVAACQAIGPETIQRDRLDYTSAIGDSWKEQVLLNIVKLRYSDVPMFLDVSSVISSYTLQSQVEISARLFPKSAPSAFQNFGVTGLYTDRPTISYAPLTGEKFINNLLRPIPPQAIFAMIQAGTQADYILRVTVRAINDIYNYSGSRSRARHADPAFQRVIGAFRRIQQAGAMGMRIEKRRGVDVTLIFFRENAEEDVAKDIQLLSETLGIAPDKKEILLTFGSLHHSDGEIALLTRSMMEMLSELAVVVKVPEQHLAEGRARSIPESVARENPYPLVHIHSGSEPPTDANVSVRYRDYWFWIDDCDIESKRVFTFLRIFSSITKTGVVPQAPIITIPAN